MYRGTTPTYTFILPDTVDLSLATKIYVTFAQIDETEIMTKTDADLVVSENTVEVYLTQEETLSFPNGQIKVQINWLYEEQGKVKRACSEKVMITAKKNLIDEVITSE